jgi:hypothetical protein
MSLVFISYRREDSAGYAGRLHESLERRLGEGEVFRDADAIEPGQDFVDAITSRLSRCKACLVLIGREWADATDESGVRRLDQERDYVRLEIAAALARPDVLVVPVLVEGVLVPAAGELPESIRALSRRQAVSLRDETWDSDVDRLVGAIRKAAGLEGRDRVGANNFPAILTSLPTAKVLRWAGIVVVLLIALVTLRSLRSPANPTETAAIDSVAVPEDRPQQAVGGPAYAIAIPRLSEVEHGDLIYTLLSGGVTRHGNSATLRLRFRLSNEGRVPANFWNDSFRLATGGQVLSPTGDLNQVVDGHSLTQGVVTFELPADITKVSLRVFGVDGTGEVPLDLRSTGAPAETEKLNTTDALSSAVLVRLVREPQPLGSGRAVSYTLLSASARRFTNTLRIVATVRVANERRVPFYFGSDAIRLIADDQTTAPTRGPNDAIDAKAMSVADFVFDVPPSTQGVRVVATGYPDATVSLDLPPALR